MKKQLLLLIALLIGGFIIAQNARQSIELIDEGTEYSPLHPQNSSTQTDAISIWTVPSNNSTSGNTRAPGNASKYQRTEYLITAAEMAASGFPAGNEINSIGFLIATAGATTQTGTLTIYLRNTTDATYTLGANWTTTGFTMVSTNSSWTVPIAVGSYEIPFVGGTPFTYTGAGVYVAWEFSNPGTAGTTAVVHYCNNTLANSLYGNRSATALPTALTVSGFRPATIFGNNFYTDIVGVTNIYTLARNPVPYGAPTPIDVRVSNVSASPATFDVTLTIKDATNTFTRYTSTQTVTNLAGSSATILNFTGWNPTIQEDVTISAVATTVSGENWTNNNTLAIPCSINNNLYSYTYTTTGAGGYGFTYPGTGIFAAKFSMNGQGKVTGSNLVIANSAVNTGNTIYAVVMNSAGAILGQSANYTITAGDLGTNKNFTFPTPVVFTDEVFYVGIAQTAGTVQWFPMGTFPESPARANTFYSAAITGGTLTAMLPTDNLKFGIEAQVAPNFNIPVITTTAASAITNSTATVNGTVMANSNTVNVSFEYGTTVAYGTTVTGTPASITGTTVTSSLGNLTGLLPFTTYHYRAVGNIGLFKFYGADLTFTTLALPPTVVTLTATAVGNSDATLRGTINANGQTTAASFEYGLTTSYGTTVSAIPATVNGSSVTPVTANLTGLSLNTTYHYRVIGTNIGGTSVGNDITFTTGCSAPVSAGIITGLTGVCPGTNAVAYSVPAIVNATTYVWSLPGGAIIATGSGTNSITVDFSDTAVSGNVSVYGSNICSDGSPSSLAVTINPLPNPSLTTGPVGVCVGSTGVIYQTQPGMSAYTWTISSGGTIMSGAGTNSITVNWNTIGAQTLGINYTTPLGCTLASPNSIAINVVPLPIPTINGPANACLGFTTNVYSTQTGMTGYNWIISPVGVITSGTGTNTITVTWNTLGAKTVTVNYTNAEGCSAAAPSSINVIVNPTSSPTLTGPDAICAGSTGVIYTTQPGYSNYVWNISYGGIITSGANTNQVAVDWLTAGTRNISVNYSNALGCAAVVPANITVTVNSTPVPIISGPSQLCQGSSGITYSTQLNYTDYIWTVSVGGTITSGAGTNVITVTWNDAGSQSVSAQYTNALGCQSESPSVFLVSIDPKPANAGVVLGSATVCAGATEVVYTTAPIQLATSYLWTLPAGATFASGANTRTIKVNFAANASSGIVKVSGVNDCGPGVSSPNFNVVVNPIPPTPVITQHGDTLSSSANTGNQWYLEGVIIPGATGKQHVAVYTGNYTVVVTLTGCSSLPSNAILVLPVSVNLQEANQSFDIYPNPNKGVFDIKADNLKSGDYTIGIYNNLGSRIWQKENISINGTYSSHVILSESPSGVYIVILRNKTNSIIKKMIIVN